MRTTIDGELWTKPYRGKAVLVQASVSVDNDVRIGGEASDNF
jgi:hypothetical protein